MKNIIVVIVVIGGIIGLTFWLKKAPPSPSPDVPFTATAPETAPAPTTPPVQEKQLPVNKIINKNGMKIEITKEGSGPEITNGKTAVVDYVGKLSSGSVFDASKKHGDTGFSFSLGAGQVIKGWDQGVLGMKVGETRILTIPPELGYGASGAGGVIPPNATVIFEVTLLAIK